MGVGPSFLGIGAQKAGTTWLHRMLSMHPDIGMPEQKELHFWDRETPDAAGIAAYLARFKDLRGRARGEITPSYAILPPERIALIHRHLPELRLIYVLRNPVERAWSQARMELSRHVDRHGGPPADLGAWLAEQFRSTESLARGDYATCLSNWRSVYTPKSIRVFLYEDAFAAPRDFLKECVTHLGVDGDFYAAISDTALAEPVYPEESILKIGRLELPEDQRLKQARLLHELYAPRIEALGKLLGRDLNSLWLEA